MEDPGFGHRACRHPAIDHLGIGLEDGGGLRGLTRRADLGLDARALDLRPPVGRLGPLDAPRGPSGGVTDESRLDRPALALPIDPHGILRQRHAASYWSRLRGA